MIELGVPFSDPMADGSVIEAASVVALKNGVLYSDVLKYASEARRQGLKVPMLMMGYYNSFLAAGVERGHLTPVSSTHAAVASLAYAPELEAELFPLVAARRYDRRPVPIEEKDGALITLAIQERDTDGEGGRGCSAKCRAAVAPPASKTTRTGLPS